MAIEYMAGLAIALVIMRIYSAYSRYAKREKVLNDD